MKPGETASVAPYLFLKKKKKKINRKIKQKEKLPSGTIKTHLYFLYFTCTNTNV